MAGRFDTDRNRNDHRDCRQSIDRDDDRHDNHYCAPRPNGQVDIHIGSGRVPPPVVYDERVWVEPVYRNVITQVWVPASYTTVVERVWIEPVVQRVVERVWIPDRHEERDIIVWQNGCPVTQRESVCVEPGHYADVSREVIVSPGRYEDRPRQQLVCDAHYETITRQEVIAPGHWETRPMRLDVTPPQRDRFHLDLRIPIGR